MKRRDVKYIVFSAIYVVGLIIAEFLPIFYIFVLSAIFACFTGIILVLVGWKKRKLSLKVILLFLLLIPFIDIATELSNLIRNQIKGEIVLSASDKTIASSKSIVLRRKNNKLTAEYSFSVCGFGPVESGNAIIIRDSILIFKLPGRLSSEALIYHKKENLLIGRKSTYLIYQNKIFN